jgi:type III secretion system low calcium response chaperone LcrH/SycD
MEMIRQLIKDLVAKTPQDLSETEKAQYEDIMIKIFEEHQKPKDVLGFSDETMEYIYSYGYRLYNNGNYRKAAEIFIILVILEPLDPRFTLALGAANHRLNNWTEAIDNYYRCSLQDPTSPLPFYYMYDCYRQNDLLEESALCLEEVIKRAGDQKAFAKMKEKSRLTLEGLRKQIATQPKESSQSSEEYPQAVGQ